MEYIMNLIGWQLFFGLSFSRQKKDNPALKLPTLDELKQMKKEVLRRFRQHLKIKLSQIVVGVRRYEASQNVRGNRQ